MKGLKKILVLAIILVVAAGTGQAASKLSLDKAHSSVSFTIRHMVVSKVRGQFKDFSVTAMADLEDITKSSVEAVIKTASIDTGNEKRDAHLRSADFFDVEKYPDITFKSKAIKKKGDGYVAEGTLTMHGVVKEVELDFQILGKIKDGKGKLRVGLEIETELDRRNFGLKWNRTLDKGGLVVGNEVKVEILLEMLED